MAPRGPSTLSTLLVLFPLTACTGDVVHLGDVPPDSGKTALVSDAGKHRERAGTPTHDSDSDAKPEADAGHATPGDAGADRNEAGQEASGREASTDACATCGVLAQAMSFDGRTSASGGLMGDTWASNGAAWSEKGVEGPSARAGAVRAAVRMGAFMAISRTGMVRVGAS